MGVIPKEYDRLPIGRQITRTIGKKTENGIVQALKRASGGSQWTSVYRVNWESADSDPYEEELALSTIQSYYTDSDTYVDEPYIEDEIRLLQKVCRDRC